MAKIEDKGQNDASLNPPNEISESSQLDWIGARSFDCFVCRAEFDCILFILFSFGLIITVARYDRKLLAFQKNKRILDDFKVSICLDQLIFGHGVNQVGSLLN